MTSKQEARLVEVIKEIANDNGLPLDLVILALTYRIVENEIIDQVDFLRKEASEAVSP